MMNFGSFGYGFGFFGLALMFLWWALVIAGIVALVKWLTGPSSGSAAGKSALDVLKDRYAKGEITKQEFEEKKKDITQ
jgi:putative membrane protein